MRPSVYSLNPRRVAVDQSRVVCGSTGTGWARKNIVPTVNLLMEHDLLTKSSLHPEGGIALPMTIETDHEDVAHVPTEKEIPLGINCYQRRTTLHFVFEEGLGFASTATI